MDGQFETTTGARPRANNRRAAILDAAARCFREKGYAATTMRDIAAAAGMLAGSLYYHFPSKSALLLAVHQEGVRRIADAVDAAVTGDAGDPWTRLRRALTAHLHCLLDGGDYAQVVIRDLPADEPELKAELVRLRDRYEARFKTLIDDLPDVAAEDRRWLRLMLLGAANWSRTWFRPGGAAPDDIAARFVALLRPPHFQGVAR